MSMYFELSRKQITNRLSFATSKLKICMALARAITSQDLYRSYALQEIKMLLESGDAGKPSFPIKRRFTYIRVYKERSNLVVQANITLTRKCRLISGWIVLEDMVLPQTIIEGLKGRAARKIVDHPYLDGFEVCNAKIEKSDSWIQLERRYLDLSDFLQFHARKNPPVQLEPSGGEVTSMSQTIKPSTLEPPNPATPIKMPLLQAKAPQLPPAHPLPHHKSIHNDDVTLPELARLKKARARNERGLAGVEWRLEVGKLGEKQRELLKKRRDTFALAILEIDAEIEQYSTRPAPRSC